MHNRKRKIEWIYVSIFICSLLVHNFKLRHLLSTDDMPLVLNQARQISRLQDASA